MKHDSSQAKEDEQIANEALIYFQVQFSREFISEDFSLLQQISP